MLSDTFQVLNILAAPLRGILKAMWDQSANTAARGEHVCLAPYKLEPPSPPSQHMQLASVSATTSGHDPAARYVEPELLWQQYLRGAYRREVTIHLTSFSIKNGGRASVLNAQTQQFLGYTDIHTLVDLLERSDQTQTTSPFNPNYMYISNAIDELMKMEVWEGFRKETPPTNHPKTPDGGQAVILEFRRK